MNALHRSAAVLRQAPWSTSFTVRQGSMLDEDMHYMTPSPASTVSYGSDSGEEKDCSGETLFKSYF